MIKLYKGDCLIESDKIESGSVDLILTDLPYGNMKGINEEFVGYGRKNHDGHLWDNVIDTDKIMNIANSILRKNGKMVLFAQDPFSTELKTKALPNLPFNYSMIWKKDNFANALIAKKAPVNYYEDVLVFSKNNPKNEEKGNHPLSLYSEKLRNFTNYKRSYFKQKLNHINYIHLMEIKDTRSQCSICTKKVYNELISFFNIDEMNGFMEYSLIEDINNNHKKEINDRLNIKYPSTFNLWEGKKYKSNILKYKKDYTGHHPTQKPVLLLEDLIKTFSNEGDNVVDLTMGSGSTGVACVNTKRNFIGIEMDSVYFNTADERIKSAGF